MSETELLPLGTLVGERYRLTRLLGAGAMGTVYEAECDDGDIVAVKTLLRSGTRKDADERHARFDREAVLCEKLNHPNIVPVQDHGIDAASATPYLVMPLLDGEDMNVLLARTGPLDPSVAVPLFVQACHGLESAHAAGVIHRDVKPSNLFVERRSGHITVRVSDFGLAKSHGELNALTPSGAFIGTAQYVSPEQATNAKHADARTDVWGLAMSLYHALAGAPAFARTGSFLAFIVQVKASGVPPLQDIAPWIPAPIARVVHGALIRDVALRCPSMIEFRLGLEMVVGLDATRKRVRYEDAVGVADSVRSAPSDRARLPRSWNELLRV